MSRSQGRTLPDSPNQIDAHTASLRAQQEDEALISRFAIERVHQSLAVFRGRAPIEAMKRVPFVLQNLANDVECAGPIGDDDDLFPAEAVEAIQQPHHQSKFPFNISAPGVGAPMRWTDR